MPTIEWINTEQTDTQRQMDQRRCRENPAKPPAALPSLYFAYGSNLNVEQMMGRCPTARALGSLTLPDWRLEFRGAADIVSCAGAEVVGALYRVWEQDELALDRYEGFRPGSPTAGLYRKVYRKLEDAEGRIKSFMFYVMNQEDTYPPQRYYLDTIRQGYADWKLPMDTLDAAVRRSQSMPRQTEKSDHTRNNDAGTRDLFGEDYGDV